MSRAGDARIRKIFSYVPGRRTVETYFLQFTCTGDARSTHLGGSPAGKVRLFGLTCTGQPPQNGAQTLSPGKVNRRNRPPTAG